MHLRDHHWTVVVYGAYGHTGRFVVAELLHRGLAPVLAGRDAARLRAMQAALPATTARAAAVDDGDALAAAFAGADVVLNCAGPFLDTALPVARAALRAGAHYLDVAAEQRVLQEVYAQLDAEARRHGVVALPGLGFYGGLGDLLASWAMAEWPGADDIVLGTRLSHWHPTRGTRVTGERNHHPRLWVEDGRLAPLPSPPPRAQWRFAGDPGPQEMVAMTLSETVAIHRHLRSRNVVHWLNRRALEDVRDPHTPPPPESGRSPQTFVLRAGVRRGGTWRVAEARGNDIYASTAPLLAEAVQRLLRTPPAAAGACAPGELFDAGGFLQALRPALDALERREGEIAPWA